MSEISKLNGYDLKDKKSIRTYDTVALMKADETLKEGQHIKTRGYYLPNDGGSAEYIIKDSSNSYYEELDNNLVAELIINDIINVDQFGAKGDGINDDFIAFQNALDHSGLIVLGKNKNYLISDYLRIKANTTLDLNNSTLTTSLNRIFYNFLDNDDFTEYNGNGNITIKNGKIDGGCISLIHGENINIENIQFRDTANNHFIELCACKNVYINNCNFINTLNQTNKGCINLDPCIYSSFPWLDENSETYDNTVNDGITITNCNFDGVMRGIDAHAETTYHNKNITIYGNNINATNETSDCDGMQLFACDNVKAYSNSINCYRYGFIIYGNNVSIYNNTIISRRSTSSPPVYIYKTSYNLFLSNNKGYTNTDSRMWNSCGINPNEENIDATFIYVDPFTNITSSTTPSDSNIEIDLRYEITKFNRLIVVTGYTTGANAGTIKTTEIKSFYQDNFKATEEYDLGVIESGMTMYIVNSKKLRFKNTTQTVRTVMFAKD